MYSNTDIPKNKGVIMNEQLQLFSDMPTTVVKKIGYYTVRLLWQDRTYIHSTKAVSAKQARFFACKALNLPYNQVKEV